MNCKLLKSGNLRNWTESGYEPVGRAFESLRAHHSSFLALAKIRYPKLQGVLRVAELLPVRGEVLATRQGQR